MSNQEERLEDNDLNKLFDNVDTTKIRESLQSYLDCLNGFYEAFGKDTNTSLMRFIDVFEPENSNEDTLEFVAKSLQHANYDESALRNECIVLFSEPVIVSELSCIHQLRSESEDAVRLISYAGMEKKFTTKKLVHSERLNSRISTKTYMVHDVVFGLILPKRSILKFVKFVTYRALLLDYKKLERAQKALQYASDTPRIEIQNVTKQLNEISSIISRKRDVFNTIQGDIHALEQEKSHAESILESTRASLEKLRSDLDKNSIEFNKLVNSVVDENDKLVTVQAKLKAETGLLKKEEDRLKLLQKEVGEASESLTAIKTELADAKREKNLTNFDTLGHSTETGRQLVAYYLFAAATFTGLLCMAVYIYWNSQNFSDSFPYLLNVSGWNILLSRLPLVAATTLIIGGLSGVFFYLIKHIISLNTEKMTMLKAGILAEQITNSLDCKEMNDQERLEFQRNTKIKLIMQVFSKNEPDINQSNIIIEALKALNSK